MPQKICIISFDHWDYDKHIVTALQKKGIESFHIKIGAFKHKNVISKIGNALSKIFLGKNPKLKKRQDYILDVLQKKGVQDQILVINPELIDKEYHLKIKKYTSKYIAYLYDSISRCPVEHLLTGIFDEIYSFDDDDIVKYNFSKTSNYIYFEPENNSFTEEKVVYIGSIDERVDFVEEIGNKLKEMNKNFFFLAIGKKATLYNVKNIFTRKYKNVIFRRKRLSQNQTLEVYKNSSVILDIVRKNQTGLSFRIFEAIGLNKNILTNNSNITNYDVFYSGKIKHIDSSNISKQDLDFSDKNYDSSIVTKYGIQNWVTQIFKL